MSWIQTFSGKKVYPLGLTHNQVCLADVAQGLAMTVRFRGQCQDFYSVAQHSVMVAAKVPERLALAALLHDAGEVYLFDACRPIKSYIQFQFGDGAESMEQREEMVLRTVFEAFAVAWPSKMDWAFIKNADNRALMTEKRDLLGPEPAAWACKDEPYPEPIIPLGWRDARAVFLQAFKRLNKAARP